MGTGEIIDAQSRPRQLRNQYDIIIYKADYPRIDLGGGINAFLAESVVATVEIKSLLTQQELDTAIQSASNAKKLTRNLITSFTAGYVPPDILSYVIAYDGPVNATTVQNWLVQAEASQALNQQMLPPTLQQRLSIPSESIDGVFCLGRHSVVFDNTPISPITDSMRAGNPQSKRWMMQSPNGNLLSFFILLTQAGANVTGQWANLISYVQNVQLPGVSFTA